MPTKSDRYDVEESGEGRPSRGLPTDISQKIFVQPNVVKPRGPDRGQLQQENEELKGQLEQLQAMIQGGSHSSSLSLQDGSLMVQGFQLSPTGLIAPDEITQESWEQLGLLLFRLEGSIQWLIGDWLAYGANFGYGDVKQLAIDMGREPGTFWEYAYVCRSVESWVRTQDLSYGHHKLVAALAPDEQVAALAHAVENGLSVANFRKWLRGDQGQQESLPSGGGFTSIAKEASRYIEHDPSTLKAEEKAAGLSYIQRMRAVFDAWEAKARS